MDPFLVGVAGVGNGVGRDKLLLNRAQAHEARQEVGATSLVVGTTGTGTTEGLLANNGASALAVDIEVTSGVAKVLISNLHSVAVLSEDGASQTVDAGGVDLLTDLDKVSLGGVLVRVDDNDGTEELARQKRVVGVGGTVHSGLDVPSLGGIVGATSKQLKLGVVLGLVDNTGEFVEGALVDNWAAEVGEIRRLANLDLLHLRNDLVDKVVGNGGSNVGAGSGTALLTLELKGTTDGLNCGVTHIGGLVDQVEVLATSLADNARIAPVLALRHTLGDFAIEHTEDISATSEVKTSEFLVVEDGAGDLLSLTGHELNNVLGEASLEKDLVNEPVGSNRGRRGLPEDDVTHQSGRTGQIATDSGEVKGADSVDETLQRTVLEAAETIVSN